MKQYKNREEVEEKYKWDLTEYYKSDDEFFETYAKLNKELDILKNYVGCTPDTNKLYAIKFENSLLSNKLKLEKDIYDIMYIIGRR